jgi:SNF2 family DNA or RNA helicase
MCSIYHDRFVKHPIKRPVALSERAKRIANELIDLGFTDTLTLGKAPALELMMRLQEICNGFEPVERNPGDSEREIALKPLAENPKLDELMVLMEEIDAEKNQIVVWSSRKALIRVICDALEAAEVSYVRYDGDASDKEKGEAERKFETGEAQVFVANQASGAYGLNCLARCSYAVYMCIDGSVEKYHQSQHRILRGQLYSPKFSYAVYAEGTIEERQWAVLEAGQELIEADNRKEKFLFI